MPLNNIKLGGKSNSTAAHKATNVEASVPNDTVNTNVRNTKDATYELLRKNFRDSKYKDSTKWITSEVLLTAPADFFDKFQDDITTATQGIRAQLTEKGRQTIISEAKNNPTDESLQAKTYFDLQTEITTYTTNTADGRNIMSSLTKDDDKNIFKALVINELIGLGPLQPLWDDPKNITEIICNGPFDIQVEIHGQIQKVPACHFKDREQLENLIEVLYTSINKKISANNPMGRGRLKDKSRMMVVDKSVAPDGPNFNIRRHSDDYWTPERILGTGEVSKELMTYLGNLIYNGVSFLVIGGTGTGKTTLLDSLTAFYSPHNRIVTLEDNLEMKPHPRKLLAAAMEVVPSQPGSISSGVSMRDLVKASLQMRPDTIIIGEVTDGAAYDLSNALNTGHAGASTVHANNADAAVYRLMSLILQSDLIKSEQAAYSLIASAFDVIITVQRFPIDGARRITEVSEVGSEVIKNEQGEPSVKITPLWEFIPDNDVYQNEKRTEGIWKEVNKLSKDTVRKHYLDMKGTKSWEELQKIAKL